MNYRLLHYKPVTIKKKKVVYKISKKSYGMREKVIGRYIHELIEIRNAIAENCHLGQHCLWS